MGLIRVHWFPTTVQNHAARFIRETRFDMFDVSSIIYSFIDVKKGQKTQLKQTK